MILHWLFCKHFQLFLSTCGACLEVVLNFYMKINLFWFIESQFSTSWHAKTSLTLNEPIENVLSANLHAISEHANMEGGVCKTTNSRLKVPLDSRITLL